MRFIFKAVLLVAFLTSSKFHAQDSETKAEYTPAIFFGCEDIKDPVAQAECSEKTMQSLAHGCVRYPELAKEAGISGIVTVIFDVNEKGEIENIEVLKSMHEYLDNESVRAVKKLPNYVSPAYRNGVPVREKKSVKFKFVLA